MVNISVAFFLFAEVFLFVILVNFFIAMVGQIYDETMANSQIQEYDHYAEMNKECFMFYEYIKFYR